MGVKIVVLASDIRFLSGITSCGHDNNPSRMLDLIIAVYGTRSL
jgi:hypothetical protein